MEARPLLYCEGRAARLMPESLMCDSLMSLDLFSLSFPPQVVETDGAGRQEDLGWVFLCGLIQLINFGLRL